MNEVEHIKKLLFEDRLTQYGKRELVKYLEQKEAILDKITDKLREDKIQLTEELKYYITEREARLQLKLINKYLNIIEGE